MTNTLSKEKKWDLKITLAGVALGGLIAIIPTWITLWASDKDKVKDRKLAVIHRRIELIDRTSQVFYKLPGVEELMNFGISNNPDPRSYNATNGEVTRIPKDINVSKEMATARAEFFSLIIQNQLYFGPKTNQAIEKMFIDKKGKKVTWWLIPEEEYSKVLKEMVSELNYE